MCLDYHYCYYLYCGCPLALIPFWEDYFYSVVLPLLLFQKLFDYIFVVFFSRLSALLCWSLFLFFYTPHFLAHSSLVVSLEIIIGQGIDLDNHYIKWFALETEIILSFLRVHPSTAFRTLLLTMMATPFLLRDSSPQ